MKIETFTTKKNVGQEHSTWSSKRDPLGSFMSRCRNLFILAFVLIMGCAINPAKAQNDTIQIDFGTTASPANWNFLNTNTLNSIKSALINSKGVATTVGMKLTGVFTNFNNAGTPNPAPSTGFPGTVTQDNIYAGPTARPKYEISGLDPTKEYTFIIFCSRIPGDTQNRNGRFQFTGSTVGSCTLDANGNTSNIASASAKPTAAGVIDFAVSSVSGGNVHLNAMKIVQLNPVSCTTTFSKGALTVCQDAENETYTATADNHTSIVYSVHPTEAGVIDPVTGVMDWNATYFGALTITATSTAPCGISTATREVMIYPATGDVSFTQGAMTLCQNAENETYTATSDNSTSIVYSILPPEIGEIDPVTGEMDWDPSFFGTAVVTATAEGQCGIKTAYREVLVHPSNGVATFTEGVQTVCQDAENETYTAISDNNTPIVYSVLPAEAGVIDPVTGVMDWDANFSGTATITGGSEVLCGIRPATRKVTVLPATGVPTFTAGATTLYQDDENETYTAAAVNSTSIVYSVLPAEAGVIDPAAGVMDWDASFFGTATITATAEGLCGTSTAEREVTVDFKFIDAKDTIQIDFGATTGPTNWVKYSSHTAGANITNMINSKGVATQLGMLITTGFGGAKTEGSNPTDPSNGFPLSVTNDYFYIGAGGTAIAEINGLNPNKDYTFIIFASRPGADGTVREGKYQFIGSTEGVCFLNATTNTSLTATATARPTAEGKIIFKVSQNAAGNAHLNAMKIIYDNTFTCTTTFTKGAETVCPDAANETYKAITTNNGPIVYSVLPAEAGVIDPVTGVMDWDANFTGTATITATADESCGTATAKRIVKINPPITFTSGTTLVYQDAVNETYIATAPNSTSIVYSVLPAEAGVIDPAAGVMDWDAAFFGTATITATAEGLCGTSTADRIVTIMVKPVETINDTIQIDFGSVASPPNWNFYNTIAAGTNKTNLINSKGISTPVGMMITTGFGGINTTATSTPDPSTGFPGTVTADNFYVGAGGTPEFVISGLDPTTDYTFIIFASRMPADANIREGKYQFIGSTEGTCYLNATGNTANTATATARPTDEGKIIFKISQTGAGNVHLNAMKIVQINQVVCTTSFTEGALTVPQDAANEIYKATTTNNAPIVYSVLPAEAGVIDPATGVMDWDAKFFGTATITATADESCGSTTADRVVTVNKTTGTEVSNKIILPLVFPNPVKDNVNVQVSTPSKMRIMDITGKVLIERTVNSGNNQINLNLKSGIYMVRVTGQNNSTYTTKLVVK